MSTTASTLIRGALKNLGLFQASETPPAEDLADGLVLLNQLVSAWRTQRLTAKFVERVVIPLTADTDAYVVDAAGTRLIEAVALVYDRDAIPLFEKPLTGPLTLNEWNGINDKTISSQYPSVVYFDNALGVATQTAHVYPVPNQSQSDLILWCPVPVARFATLTTEYTLPEGYERALRLTLALELAPDYDVPVSADLRFLARGALDMLKGLNLPMQDLGFDPAISGRGRRYNIETDV